MAWTKKNYAYDNVKVWYNIIVPELEKSLNRPNWYVFAWYSSQKIKCHMKMEKVYILNI